MHWYIDVLSKYAVFEGRARRKEYWMYTLFNVLVLIGCLFVDNVSGLTKATNGLSPLYTLYALGTILPGLGVGIRRLHDTGRSGWLLLVGFIPCIGGILLLIWTIEEGTNGRNEYGPDPKGIERRALEEGDEGDEE